MNPLISVAGFNPLRAPGISPANAPAAPANGVAADAGFGSMVSSMIQDTIANVKTGEATAIAGMQGKVPLQQVVEAVMQAEQSLHTVLAVRDKVVGAYLEISRMQM